MEKQRFDIQINVPVWAETREEALEILENYLPNYNLGVIDEGDDYPLEPVSFVSGADNLWSIKRDPLVYRLYLENMKEQYPDFDPENPEG